ncbi:sin3 histone deacetylase corepressor complex component SDS3 isoform X2 [Parasteatoda tepidariorum]|uniref:sin3 histone deacetylase corepressor complex component SDS3 isoform X2 n=1 Tax=Parasteatoda tepidariorum TaxID=114398 RepID=UPI00077F9DE5|nr:sin3 histone deacetylase corepressor complex component SDS3 isoform X2 [Parasteatoda tepidariorum]
MCVKVYMKSIMSEYDLDLDEESDYEAAEKNENESDEDTEDASETDMVKQEEEYTEIKEQMYQDKLANLKKQLQQLNEGVHPDYLKRLKKLEQNYDHRILMTQIFETIELERIERDYILEKEAAHKEFEDKKVELRENLISDLEEKKRLIEHERNTMELTGDSMETKPVTTRKLRRRPNDPLPVPEKKRKTLQTSINFLLDESEIMDDLRSMNKYKASTSKRHDSCESGSSDRGSSIEVRVEDGKLYYDKKWYHRGQQVYYEGKEVGTKNSGLICTISSSEIWIKRTTDSNKVRIYISQLQKGKITIRRRSA